MKTYSISLHRSVELIGAFALVALPLCLALAFALHFTTVNDLLNFQWAKPDYSAEHFLQTLRSTDGGFRFFLLPHLVGYFSLPLFVFSAMAMAAISYPRSPKLSVSGLLLTLVGTLFLAGVFSAWLSFSAINQLDNIDSNTLISVLVALTRMQGPLMISTVLSGLTMLGMILLGIALHRTHYLPRWSTILYIAGNAVVLVFMDLDNWMLIGALMQCVGIAPLAVRILRGEHKAFELLSSPAQ